MRKSYIPILLLLFFYLQASVSIAEDKKNPAKLLQKNIQEFLDFRHTQQPDLPALYTYIDQKLSEQFDFVGMARWIAGRDYQYLSISNKADLVQRLKGDFLHTFAKKIHSYQGKGVQVKVRPVKYLSTNEAIIYVQIESDNRPLVKIDFRYIRSKKGWRIFDVRANGASALAYYRNRFARQIYAYRNNIYLINR